MNFYCEHTGRVLTRTLMDYKALPQDLPTLAELGYFPVQYDYISFDQDIEEMLPDGEIVKIDGQYTQKFKKVPLDEEHLRWRLFDIANATIVRAFTEADAVVAPEMNNFSNVEKQTWPQQREEVKAYLADKNASTPTLDGLAQARGISRELMLEKAIAKVTAFEEIAIKVIGRQQAYEDAIKALANDESKSLVDRIKGLREMTFSYYDEPRQA